MLQMHDDTGIVGVSKKIGNVYKLENSRNLWCLTDRDYSCLSEHVRQINLDTDIGNLLLKTFRKIRQFIVLLKQH